MLGTGCCGEYLVVRWRKWWEAGEDKKTT